MKVFLSWSGDRSRHLAEKLHRWLPNVIQSLDPWMSHEDVAKGTSWLEEIRKGLSEVNGIGIFCLTPENLNSPWLNFEAGYLAACDQARVCVVMLGVSPGDLRPPLGIFQGTSATEQDFRKLLLSLNQMTGTPLKGEIFDKAFASAWPELRDSLEEIASQVSAEPQAKKRSPEDMLSELLVSTRRMEAMISPLTSGVGSLTDYQEARASLIGSHPKSFIVGSGIRRVGMPVGALMPQLPVGNNAASQMRIILERYPFFSASTQDELKQAFSEVNSHVGSNQGNPDEAPGASPQSSSGT